jgi:hypothetical protein
MGEGKKVYSSVPTIKKACVSKAGSRHLTLRLISKFLD